MERKKAALHLKGELWHRWRGVSVMGGATVFPRHIFHLHRNYSDTMAALQTSPYLTCPFFYYSMKKWRHNSWKTLGKPRRKSQPAFLH